MGCPVKHGTVSTLKLCLHNITEGGHGDVPQDSEGENFKKLLGTNHFETSYFVTIGAVLNL